MRALLPAAILACATTTAHADATRAWAAARVNLPARTEVVIGIDVATLAGGNGLVSLRGMVGSNVPDAAKRCKLDAATAIEGLVFATAGGEDGGVYFAFGSVDRAKLTACPDLVVAALSLGGNGAAVVHNRGDVMDIDTGGSHTYIGWLGDTIAVMATDKTEAALKRWIGNKGAFGSTPLARTLARVDTRTAIWGAASFNPSHRIRTAAADDTRAATEIGLAGGYGAVVQSGDRLVLDIHLATEDKRQATALAERLRTNGRGTQQSDLAFTVALADAVIKGSVRDNQLLDLVARIISILVS